MARGRRAVERATSRRTATDRIVAGVLVVVAAAGLMSVLPGSSQRSVSRATCHVLTVGLGSCGAVALDLTDAALGPARCPTLDRLDAALPEVRVRRYVVAPGIPMTLSTARSGDVVAQLGEDDPGAPPDVLAGQPRPLRQVADGVAVPAHAEWYLPRGQGVAELVDALQAVRHDVAQRRSSLALLGGMLDHDDRSLPAPTLLSSTVDLRARPWPRVPDPVTPPRTGSGPATPQGPVRTSSSLQVVLDEPAVSVYNRVSGRSAVVVATTGRLGREPVTGTLRIERDSAGTVQSVLLAVVVDGPAVPGEPRATTPGPAVAYVQVPVRTPTEQQLVEGWLAGPAPTVVPLDAVLGLRAPAADDQLESFLARAATVTVLRYGAVEPSRLAQRVAAELRSGRREDWQGVRLVEAVEVDPTSTGAGRRPVADEACRT